MTEELLPTPNVVEPPPLPPRVARPRRGGAEEVISAADVLPVLEPTPHEEQLHSPRGSDDPPVLSHT
jgi:hypothetical protein